MTSPTPSRAKLGSCLALREGTPEGGDRTLMTDDATAHQDMPSTWCPQEGLAFPARVVTTQDLWPPLTSPSFLKCLELGASSQGCKGREGGAAQAERAQLWVLDGCSQFPQFLEGSCKQR